MSQQDHPTPRSKNALIGLVLGLVSFAVLLLPIIGLIVSSLSIFFAYRGIKEEKKVLSVVALVIGILGLLLATLWNYFLFFGSFT